MPVPPVQSLRALIGKDHATLAEVWDARVKATPEAVALLWEGQRWSYAQATAEIEAFAGFAATRLRPGHRVASYLPNRPEALWCWLGTAMADAVFVPLNRKHKGALLADMLARSGAAILVTERAALADLPDLAAAGIRTLVLVDDATSVPGVDVIAYADARAPAPPRPPPRPGDLAEVLYTSGTTGRSKAVMIPHNQYVRSAARLVDAYGLRATDVFHN